MGPSRPCRSGTQSRACLNCQRRKSRCMLPSDTEGSCSYCSRTGKTCSFVNPPNRTSLTRKNLDAAELRSARLEALLRSLHPDLDIEEAIANLPEIGHASPETIVVNVSSIPDHDQPSHEFEWHETSPPDTKVTGADSRIQDGMATLSTLDAGYLGSSSGSNLLQEIASMLPELATPNGPNTSQEAQRPQPEPFSASEAQLDPPRLASAAITSHLIDAYFLFYNISYPILHERTFRHEVATRSYRRSRSTWNVIYFMVLAIGHWVSTTDEHHAQSRYYSTARSYLSIQMLESGTLETVQAFLLMSNYLQKIDRPNTGYNLMGIAYKLALGLGLHREPPGIEDNLGHERRRQLFWTVYCFDSGFNITTGRPPNISEGVIDARIPKNIHDKEVDLRLPVPCEVDGPTTLSAIIAQAQLAKLANVLYHEFLLAKTANMKLEYQVAESIDRSLESWRQTLPAFFASTDVPTWFLGPRSVVLWKQQNLRIILWRGSKRNHAFLPSKMDAEAKCLEVAMQSIHDIAEFCRTSEGIVHLGIAWYATYFLFQAALVIEASHLDKSKQQSDDETALWQVMVSRARDCLVMLARKSKSASRCLEVLDLIHQRALAHNTVEQLPAMPPNDIIAGSAQELNDLQTIPAGEVVNEYAAMSMNEFGLYDETSDPTLRLILDQTSWGDFDNTAMDVLFNDWVYPQIDMQADSG